MKKGADHAGRDKFKKEALRKGIHLLIAFTPALAAVNRPLTIALLFTGSVFYLACEILRRQGRVIPLLSRITAFAARPREAGKLVLGPVTLAAGAAVSLVIFPAIEAGSLISCSVAIYALAFGDGLSGLVGRPFGKLRPRFLWGKSVEGSCVCLVSVLVSTYAVTGHGRASLVTALVTTVVEALPLRNADNIAIPLAAGFTVIFMSALLTA